MSWPFRLSTPIYMSFDRRPDRQEALRRRLPTRGLNALLVTHLPNLRYLTGFSGSAALLLVTGDRTVLLTDSRYSLQARQEAGAVADVEIEPTNLWDRLRRVLNEMEFGDSADRIALGFEPDHLTVALAERLKSAHAGRSEPVEGLVEELRITKDVQEVEAIRSAGRLAVEAVDAVLPTIRVGDTERAIAGRLEFALRERGSEWHPFPTIVASGPRSALPHALTTERPVGRGELLLIDFGAQLGGYCADLTRTVVVGAPPDGRQLEVFDAVRAAKDEAVEGLRPGMAGREIDALARNVLEQRGFGGAFTHSLGHGLGLEVHENPRLARSSEVPVPVGAVVTIEPGAYLEGWGGIRLEDDVVVTQAGAEYLSTPSPELLAL